jgi:hypothetical protein
VTGTIPAQLGALTSVTEFGFGKCDEKHLVHNDNYDHDMNNDICLPAPICYTFASLWFMLIVLLLSQTFLSHIYAANEQLILP